ncbi:MAG: GAF domain-containing protein [Chitinophagales bacterium]|nr:GAF domain-containing protein [Chitinophagales bacterium]
MDNQQVQILIDTVQQLSLARNLETVTGVVRTTARKLTGADGAAFVLRENDLCYYADEDAISPLWKGQRFNMDTCISGWAMLNRQPVVIEDIYADDRIPHDAYRPTFVKSLAMVPIRTMEPIGAIGNYWATQRMPTAAEVMLLQSLADITSVSIENVSILNELEARVAERTHELELVNAGLESFAYSVSHDLRAPLRALTSRVDFLLQHYPGKVLDATGQKLLNGINNTATDMRTLIDELLNFSTLGKAELKAAPVNMKLMVEDVCNTLTIAETGQKIKWQVNELPIVKGDGTLIKQVWLNLIGNAIKYSSKKEVAEITIGAEPTAAGLTYYVKDNGDGFDMQYYHKLFGIFQRLHGSDEFNGHGIGLALVHRIVQRHNGKIWATATPGEGAQFYFTLG